MARWPLTGIESPVLTKYKAEVEQYVFYTDTVGFYSSEKQRCSFELLLMRAQNHFTFLGP
jgi:hypothetical protein